MIQAFGCIDGTHVHIKMPSTASHDYFCYKQYLIHSIYKQYVIIVGSSQTWIADGQVVSTMQRYLLTQT